MDYILLIIGLIVGGIIGFLAAKLLSSQKNEGSSDDSQQLQIDNATLTNTNVRLEEELKSSREELTKTREAHQLELRNATEWKSKYNALEEKIEGQKKELESLQEKFTKDFELVANKILEEKTTKFTEQNKENLDTILTPLKERITEFQKKVEDTNEKSIERSASLKEQLEMLQKLNQDITQETRSLTQALRGDSKDQGTWGEEYLQLILEKAGLTKGVHYSKETSLKTDEGKNQRLDYIINLPESKHMIIDSKVSLTAYTDYIEAEDDNARNIHLKKHLESVKNHIKTLGKKNYQELHSINTPDYVLMFIANEPALSLALKEEPHILELALNKNIVLVSISTLIATLKIISLMWKQETLNRNSLEISRQAAAMYVKFVNFTEDLEKVGTQLDRARDYHEKAVNKLSKGKDNLVRKTERLKELGVNPTEKKSISQNLLDNTEDVDSEQ